MRQLGNLRETGAKGPLAHFKSWKSAGSFGTSQWFWQQLSCFTCKSYFLTKKEEDSPCSQGQLRTNRNSDIFVTEVSGDPGLQATHSSRGPTAPGDPQPSSPGRCECLGNGLEHVLSPYHSRNPVQSFVKMVPLLSSSLYIFQININFFLKNGPSL